MKHTWEAKNMAGETIDDGMIDAAIDVVAEREIPFDSHKVITELARKNQRGYVAALHNEVEGDANNRAPFNSLHMKLGQRIRRRAESKGYKLRPDRVSSKNIFFYETDCAEYDRA